MPRLFVRSIFWSGKNMRKKGFEMSKVEAIIIVFTFNNMLLNNNKLMKINPKFKDLYSQLENSHLKLKRKPLKKMKKKKCNLGRVPNGALIISRSAVLSWLKLVSSLLEKTKAAYYHLVAASPPNESQINFLLVCLSCVRRMSKPGSSHQRITCFIHVVRTPSRLLSTCVLEWGSAAPFPLLPPAWIFHQQSSQKEHARSAKTNILCHHHFEFLTPPWKTCVCSHRSHKTSPTCWTLFCGAVGATSGWNGKTLGHSAGTAKSLLVFPLY